MIYTIIDTLNPYFFSLRKIDETISLDMKFPTIWSYNSRDESIQIVTQDKNENFTLVSYISPSTKEGCELVFNVVLAIIKHNEEQEKKDKLFQEKMKELKDLFINSSLDDLQNINFSKDA